MPDRPGYTLDELRHAESNGVGSLLRSPYATRGGPPAPQAVNGFGGLLDAFGRETPRVDDPAWQMPTDPAKDPRLAARAKVISREIPINAVQTQWSVSNVEAALESMSEGLFDGSAQLIDALFGDDRIQATLGARSGAIFGCEVMHRLPPKMKDSAAAKECRDAWADSWAEVAPEEVLSDMVDWGVMQGFWLGQILWDTSGDLLIPHITPWHPRYSYYHWTLRHYVAITLDGQDLITPGDAHWMIHAPHGEYLGWRRGALRATANPWLMKSFAYRDWARYSERHGMPIMRAYTPAAGDPNMRSQFVSALANIGQEAVVELPMGVDKQYSYGLDLLEASDRSWEAFPGLIDRCEMSIVLAILYQNLTTEVQGGSFAAARVAADVKQSAVIEADNARLKRTIYTQCARQFAALNFGDADLAPITSWDVAAKEDVKSKASVLVAFGQALNALRMGGVKLSDPASTARTFGLELGEIEHVDPLQVESQLARAAGKVEQTGDNTGEVADKAAEAPKPDEKPPEKKKKEDDDAQ